MSNKWNEQRRAIVDLMIIVSIFLLYGIYYIAHLRAVQVALYSIPFYMGLMIAKYSSLEKIAFNEYAFGLSFLTFCILVGHCNIWSNSYVDDFIKNIIDPCAFIVVLNMCKRYEEYIAAKILGQWGRYSMEIYVAHWALLSILLEGKIHLASIHHIWFFLIALIMSLPIIYACIGFSKIIEISRLARLLMYGRTK